MTDARVSEMVRQRRQRRAVLTDKMIAALPRRSARSLMSRAGVSSEHAERVLGHTQGGVKGIYDRHGYFDEKATALVALATLIGRIVNPREDNVVPFTAAQS